MRSKKKRSTLPLLQIDSDAADRLLIKKAIRTTNSPFDFHGVDGLPAAADYFLQSARENFPSAPGEDFAHDHPRPALILLDYHQGNQCATDFLYWLRTLRRNTAIAVVLYSSSHTDAQISDSYFNGANHFLRKAQSFTGTQAVIRALHVCFCLPSPRFDFLARLVESEAAPLAHPKRNWSRQ